MYVTAHHVVRPGTNLDRVNAFCYRHGPTIWAGLPPAGIPDENPGELAASSATVAPGGNRVRSYLDIINARQSALDGGQGLLHRLRF